MRQNPHVRICGGPGSATTLVYLTVVREWPVTRAVAEMLTPSTRRLATWSNSRRLQRRPRYAVPVFVLSVPPHTVQRYRRRRPDFVTNQPWPTMLRPGFPKLSTQACRTPSRRSHSSPQCNGAANQQRPAQAPPVSKTWRPRLSSEPGTAEVYFWVKEMTDRSQPKAPPVFLDTD